MKSSDIIQCTSLLDKAQQTVFLTCLAAAMNSAYYMNSGCMPTRVTEREERGVFLQQTWYKRLALFARKEVSYVNTFRFSKGDEIVIGGVEKQFFMLPRLWATNNQIKKMEIF